MQNRKSETIIVPHNETDLREAVTLVVPGNSERSNSEERKFQ